MRKFVRINIFYNRSMNDMRHNTLRIKRFAKITTILLSALAFVMCGEDPTSNEGNGNGSNSTNGDDSYEDIKVVDGKVRFYIEEKDNATRTASVWASAAGRHQRCRLMARITKFSSPTMRRLVDM